MSHDFVVLEVGELCDLEMQLRALQLGFRHVVVMERVPLVMHHLHTSAYVSIRQHTLSTCGVCGAAAVHRLQVARGLVNSCKTFIK